MPLRSKMLAITAASVLLPVIVIGSYFCRQEARSVYQGKVEDLCILARSVSEDIDIWMKFQKRTIESVAETEPLRQCCDALIRKQNGESVPDETGMYIKHFIELIDNSLPQVSEIVISSCEPMAKEEAESLKNTFTDFSDKNKVQQPIKPGNIIYNTQRRYKLNTKNLFIKGKVLKQDTAYRTEITEILDKQLADLNEGRVIITATPEVSTEITGDMDTDQDFVKSNPKFVCYISTLVFKESNSDKARYKTPLAILSFRMASNSIETLFGHGDFYVADAKGRIITLPKSQTKEKISALLKKNKVQYEGAADLSYINFQMRDRDHNAFTAPMQAYIAARKNNAADLELSLTDYVKKHGSAKPYEDIYGETVIGGWAACHAIDWVIVAEESYDEIFRSMYRMVFISILITSVIAIFFLIVSYWFAENITDPIIKLNKTVQLFANGTYSTRCDIMRQDEIGQLSEAVNSMVSKIEKTIVDLRTARNEARQANSIKSRFLSNITHELRTPLNAIIGYSEVLLEDAESRGDKDSCEDLNNIHIAGLNLLSTVNDILNITKLESGKMELFIEKFAAGELLVELTASVKALARNNNNEFKAEMESEAIELHTDKIKFRQIVTNLLGNSVKFTKNGTVGIKIQVWDGEKANKENFNVGHLQSDLSRVMVAREFDPHSKVAVVCVYDTGIGMSKEKYDMIFEEFTQADNSISRSYGGTGLGLALVRHFCQMLHCRLELVSEPGKGSAFTVKVPYEWEEISE
ncbi:HAMP domain-containing histidine kinase [bacterium]|nr:HAMP domain-containing histidine kinase [bacterium]